MSLSFLWPSFNFSSASSLLSIFSSLLHLRFTLFSISLFHLSLYSTSHHHLAHVLRAFFSCSRSAPVCHISLMFDSGKASYVRGELLDCECNGMPRKSKSYILVGCKKHIEIFILFNFGIQMYFYCSIYCILLLVLVVN